MMRKLVFAALLASNSPSWATAADAFRDGRFAEAVTQGRVEATAASLILAGRAALSIAGYQSTDKASAKLAVERAVRDFDAAIAKAPNSLEARTQKAIAIGYLAKLGQSPGEAKAARQQMEAVLARDSNFALANTALGGWHGGGVATLGAFMASTVLGASRKDMDRYFAAALAREPRVVIHPVTYAFTLLDISAKNAPRATALLKSAVALPTRDGFEVQNRKAATQVLALLTAGDAAGARTLSRRLAPFGTL